MEKVRCLTYQQLLARISKRRITIKLNKIHRISNKSIWKKIDAKCELVISFKTEFHELSSFFIYSYSHDLLISNIYNVNSQQQIKLKSK